MPRVLITSDWHFGNNVHGRFNEKSNLPSRMSDKIEVVNEMLSYAVKNGIKHWFILGDIFETSRPSTLEYVTVLDLLRRLKSAEIEVNMLFGNHDDTNTGYTPDAVAVLAQTSGAYVFDSTWHHEGGGINIGSTMFVPLSYVNRVKHGIKDKNTYIKNQLSKAFPPKDGRLVVLMHELFAGTAIGKGDFELPPSMCVSHDVIPEQVHLVFCGHIHKPQQQSKVVYVGSIDYRNFGEADHKKRFIVYDTETGVWESVPITKARPFTELHYECELPEDQADMVMDDIESFIGDLDERDCKGAVIKMSITVPNDEYTKRIRREDVEKIFMDNGAFHVAAISVIRKGSAIQKRLDVSIKGMDRKTMLAKYLQGQNMSPVDIARIVGKGELVMDEAAK